VGSKANIGAATGRPRRSGRAAPRPRLPQELPPLPQSSQLFPLSFPSPLLLRCHSFLTQRSPESAIPS
jgi:hypothetical protein